jgi:hypothetical protein
VQTRIAHKGSRIERMEKHPRSELTAQTRCPFACRHFTSSTTVNSGKKTVDYLLADVGEGITECEIVKW